MTIIEALKSGKRFRRRSRGGDLWNSPFEQLPTCRSITLCDIVEDDWEIDCGKIEVSYSQLREAFVFSHRSDGEYDFNLLAKKLGFK